MDVQVLVQLLAVVLGGNAIFDFIKWLVERRDGKKDSPERIMLRAMGEEKLDEMLHKWLHGDVRTASEWRIIDNLYKGYRALGGNGEIEKLYEEASELKTTE